MVYANDFSKSTLCGRFCFICQALIVLKLLTIEIVAFFLKTLYLRTRVYVLFDITYMCLRCV